LTAGLVDSATLFSLSAFGLTVVLDSGFATGFASAFEFALVSFFSSTLLSVLVSALAPLG